MIWCAKGGGDSGRKGSGDKRKEIGKEGGGRRKIEEKNRGQGEMMR